MIIKIALRNLFRQKRRTALTALSMGGGYLLLSLSLGLSEGSYNTIIDIFTRSQIGHLQIQHKEYLNNPSVYRTIDDLEAVARVLSEHDSVRSYSPQVLSGALAFAEKRSQPVELVGLDSEMEDATTEMGRRLASGELLAKGDAGALIDEDVAQFLGIAIGDSLVVIGQGADGSIANDVFPIRGTIRGEKGGFGSRTVYLSIEKAQQFLALPDRYHRIIVRLDSAKQAMGTSRSLNTELSGATVARPWQEVASDFFKAMELDKQGNFVVLGIIALIVSLGVMNTVLMNVLERTREFGLMKAIGTRASKLFWIILAETTFLALGSCLLAAVLAAVINTYFAVAGWTLPEPLSMAGIEFSTMYSEASFHTLGLPAVVTFLTAMLVTIPPALRAVRIRPVEALKST